MKEEEEKKDEEEEEERQLYSERVHADREGRRLHPQVVISRVDCSLVS